MNMIKCENWKEYLIISSSRRRISSRRRKICSRCSRSCECSTCLPGIQSVGVFINVIEGLFCKQILRFGL